MKHLIVPHIWDDFLMGGRHKWKKGNMWSSIFSWVTKVTKDVWVCVPPLQQKKKSEQSVEGIFDIADYIYIVR